MNRNHRIVISTALAGTVVIGGGAVAAAASAVSPVSASTHVPQANAPEPTRISVEAAALVLKLRALDVQAQGLTEALTTARAKIEAHRLALLTSRLPALNGLVASPGATPAAPITNSRAVSNPRPGQSTREKAKQSTRSTKPSAPPTHITTGASGSTTTLGDDGASHAAGEDHGSGSDQSGSND
jgi:hypothetical protein